ncbi:MULTISPECIES: flagellar biosynthetic protein FliR [Rhodophyticola]|jgi:flagellar biosynthetic protein FliR|uniref:flagellar biosynthetic protein FliR n=1 Tax=Rhodophyticola TaxID=2680018 RepID=UPI001B064A5E|nr:flagellar biosynthetic protein FliR [Roseicyclus sp.]MBO6626240.1 flagellar biosynthetic protein FliR [Roseicyclus sp.]MBO6923560.1 flagellar biosynthetic protein FliR [Roseicyclus sp.]
MIPLLSELFPALQAWLGVAAAVFLRVGAAFLALPAFGEAFIPMRVRLAAAVAFTAILVPAIGPDLLSLPAGNMPPTRFFLTEATVGLMIGVALRLVVHGLQIAGVMAAQATSLSQIMGGALPEAQPAMSNLLMLAGLTLAIMSGLHVHLAEAFLRSYQVLPAGEFPFSGDTGAWIVAQVAATFSLAFSLAAPFLIASLLYNVALGVINKAMPQLMVAFVGAPAITWGGLVLLLVTTPFILPVWFAVFEARLANPFGSP